MIRKPIGNWQFAIGKICVRCDNWRQLPVYYRRQAIDNRQACNNTEFPIINGRCQLLIANCLLQQKTLPGMRGFITMNKAELIS